MFGISFSEILLILLISLIVFGPKQLPQIARTIGTFIGNLYYYFNRIKQEVYQQSGFSITQKLGNDYAEWTPEQIASRQNWMAAQATAIWRIPQLS